MIDRLGMGLTGVLAQRPRVSGLKFGSSRCLEIGEISGAFEALRSLRSRFNAEIYIISRMVDEAAEAGARQWLQHRDFCDRTGVASDHIYFCRKRQEKASISDNVAITHFVDRRLESLSYFEKGQRLLLFCPDKVEVEAFSRYLMLVNGIVYNWNEALAQLSNHR